MAVMDEFREEREALKNADFKTKWHYFVDYYKWHVIGGAFVAFLIGEYIYSVLTAKEAALNGYLLNTYADTTKSETFVTEFAEAADIDLNEYDVLIDTSLHLSAGSLDETTITSSERMIVTMAAAEVDFIAGNEEAFLQYADTDTFFDLREIYTEEELSNFEDYLYYIDMDEIRRKEEFWESGQVDGFVPREYDHFAPEEMVDPIPVGLCIQDSPKLKGTYYFQKGPIPIAIVVNTKHLDTTLQFIDYLFEDLIQE